MLSLEYLPTQFENDLITLDWWFEAMKMDFVILPDSPNLKASPEAVVANILLKTSLNKRVIASIAGSGRRKERVESLLLALKYASISEIALVGGDDRRDGELSGVAMAQIASSILGKNCFIISGSKTTLDKVSKANLEAKIDNGVKYIITQPIFDLKQAQTFLDDFEALTKGVEVNVALGFFPIYEAQICKKINANDLGFKIPKDYEEKIAFDPFKTNLSLFTALNEISSNIHISGAKNNFLNRFITDFSKKSLCKNHNI